MSIELDQNIFILVIEDSAIKEYLFGLDVPSYSIIRVQNLDTCDFLAPEEAYTIAESSITFNDALTLNVGDRFAITRQTPITQTETFDQSAYLNEGEVERALDKLTYIAQEIRGQSGN